jgi:hypothetical protein
LQPPDSAHDIVVDTVPTTTLGFYPDGLRRVGFELAHTS